MIEQREQLPKAEASKEMTKAWQVIVETGQFEIYKGMGKERLTELVREMREGKTPKGPVEEYLHALDVWSEGSMFV